MDDETILKLLTAVEDVAGLAVLTNNPAAFRTYIINYIRKARQNHPEAYRHIRLVSSKSPKEFYILNAQKAALAGGDEAPSG